MSAIEKIEQRLAVLEAEVKKLKENRKQPLNNPTGHVWLEKIFGAFANDNDYLEAMKLGRQHRESEEPVKSKTKRRKRAHVDS